MEDLPEPLLAEIIKTITRISDLNSLSLVSKRLYKVEGDERGIICVGCGLNPATEALSSLCSRFPNLWKVEINYSGWSSDQGNQLDNKGLHVLSSHCPSLTDLTLSFCSYIDDSGLGYLANCKKLMALRLNSASAISSRGLSSVAIGCKSLSTLHLTDCMNVRSMETVLAKQEFERAGRWYETEPEELELWCPGNTGVEWLEHLGKAGSLVELVVKDCEGLSHYDLLKFGPGFMNLQKFEFDIKNDFYWLSEARDPSYNARYPHKYDGICCENMKDLRLAKMITQPEIGLRFLLRTCKALEKLSLDYVIGLDESEMIALLQNCSNLRSISLKLMPLRCGFDFRTPLTDDSLKALSLFCPMLQVVELTFACCSSLYPTEIGFTQEGIVKLIQSCPLRAVKLNSASIFYDEGMKAISSAQFLERLELVNCKRITDAGIAFITRAPCLTSLTLHKCKNVSNEGMAELARSQKLEFLTVKGCRGISEEAVQGAAKSVYYSAEVEIPYVIKEM
ncbi:hypothetical protein EJB05_19375, partial [Eragrostis curvula]